MEKHESTPHLLFSSEKGKRYFYLSSDNPNTLKSCWTVGRGHENDLVLRDQWISRNHAILQTTETGEFYLIDLGSRNGTFVNGRRVGIPVTLHNGDQITFGKTEVQYYCPSEEASVGGKFGNLDFVTLTATLHERQLTSVVVVDMRNFTVLTRQLDETILSTLIGSWFREAGEIIREAGSWVDKYIGDAIMAIWFHGSKEVNRSDILKIFQAVSKLNKMTQKLSREYPVPFELRIGAGINTGYAMVGNTGSGDHPDYTAIGDTVNAAFRLESATKEIGADVAIGEKTYSYLGDIEDAQQHFHENTVHLKGYDTPTITYGTTFEELDCFLEETNP
ncbi:adenylate/guanylate cyclase domain-containing protein [Gloeothece verrucosa]|uniref:Adenylate/guanylate cyclase n=1 Tax=Gloeothece verrucosa (strain PCC 7822) TaxID=497965 RepID=E0U8N9_GLOV7|nr:adenylate/guanylate cyclase domain-containing protein [Gloeothece verrucosa]ADN13785.1 adenylate/guanylate cyclase [Gloeothece verrucosa PCC 7822]